MPDKSLVMSFMNEEGKKVSLRLDGIKEDITGDAVGLVMDTIITKNIFQTTGGDLKVKDSAQIVSRDVQALEVK
jgi:hypothetical protein